MSRVKIFKTQQLRLQLRFVKIDRFVAATYRLNVLLQLVAKCELLALTIYS